MGKEHTTARRVMKTLNFNTELKNPKPLGLEMWKIAFSESERETLCALRTIFSHFWVKLKCYVIPLIITTE